MTATDDQSPGFDPAHVENCNLCASELKRQEAELGLRCAGCLDLFGRKSWITPSDEDPSLCPSCQRNAVYRAENPGGVAMWGKGR